MPKFIVFVENTYCQTYSLDIEADTEDDARDEAEEKHEAGDYDDLLADQEMEYLDCSVLSVEEVQS